MLKKLFMLPLMAFALVTLTAATVVEDGETIFEWEIISEETDLPNETWDEQHTTSYNDVDLDYYIKDNETYLDLYVSYQDTRDISLYYDYDETFGEMSSDNRVDTETQAPQTGDQVVHYEISGYEGYDFKIAAGSSYFAYDGTEYANLETYNTPAPTVFEEIGGALSTIVTAGSAVFVSTFDGLWDVFWDADANDGDGALNWIAYVAVLPVGFFLVRWAFRKVLGMIQQRL